MLDRDLAELYGVEVKQLKRQVKRNQDRFPADFMFELSREEYNALRSQFGTFKRGEHSKISPLRFYRTGRFDAFECIAQHSSRTGQHRNHAGFCAATGTNGDP
jgi:hypothetical protein